MIAREMSASSCVSNKRYVSDIIDRRYLGGVSEKGMQLMRVI